MRYRLLATFQGAPYEAGIGPGETGVVLFAACPPPEDLGFEPATGHWRKRVSREDVQALYESRPVGMFRGERCVVLDDLTDRLHIAYLGHDAYLAERLGYWEVDRGVFELITQRQDVTEIVEQRLPLTLQAGSGSDPGPATPLPLEAEALRAAGLSEPSSAMPHGTDTTSPVPSWTPHPHLADRGETALAAGPPPPPVRPDLGQRPAAAHDTPVHGVPLPAPPRAAPHGPVNGALREAQASAAGMLPGSVAAPGSGLAERPLAAVTAAAPGKPAGSAATAAPDASGASGLTASEPQGSSRAQSDAGAEQARQAPRRRRALRRRLPTQRIFSELAAQADIPADAYAINEEVDGAMCLVRTAEGFEVFNSLAGARHEVRVFQDEESAYFYLFGVLVADAVRTGALVPRP